VSPLSLFRFLCFAAAAAFACEHKNDCENGLSQNSLQKKIKIKLAKHIKKCYIVVVVLKKSKHTKIDFSKKKKKKTGKTKIGVLDL